MGLGMLGVDIGEDYGKREKMMTHCFDGVFMVSSSRE